MRRSRVWALPAGLAAGLTLAGCGVPESGVIQAGPAASGIHSPGATPVPPTVVALYFLHDGDLTPYPRKAGHPADFRSVLDMLFAGPDAAESTSAATELPRLPAPPEVVADGEHALTVRLPTGAGRPGYRALMQLTCTVAGVAGASAAKPTDGPGGGASATAPGSLARPEVKVSGDGWTRTLSAGPCPDPIPS
ncbi:hypothetical protein [Streptomyces sp. NPDC001068]|uniref:hypothetical protein n=1 Tax=Streptomyces sp. NPDC001068 TaxID=3364544 RepID=UPI00368E7ADA